MPQNILFFSLRTFFSLLCAPFLLSKAEFLDVIGTKVLSFYLLSIHSHTTVRHPPHTLSKSGLKSVCNVNTVYGNLKSENSLDYAKN